MRQESAGVTEALLDSARREFMEHGFHGASLRRISADSGVSTILSIRVLETRQGYLRLLLDRWQMG